MSRLPPRHRLGFATSFSLSAGVVDRPSSYRRGTARVPLLEQTIGHRLTQIAQAYPTRDALVVKHQQLRRSYAEFDEEVCTSVCQALPFTVETLSISLLEIILSVRLSVCLSVCQDHISYIS